MKEQENQEKDKSLSKQVNKISGSISAAGNISYASKGL